jgi:hypothetical protein
MNIPWYNNFKEYIRKQNYAAIEIANQDSLTLTNNTISTNSSSSYYRGIYCSSQKNKLNLSKNKIHIPNGGYGYCLKAQQVERILPD